MHEHPTRIALLASEAAPRALASSYPPAFARRMQGRLKRPLGDPFGLTHFGVNLTRLEPGAQSALMHAHDRQDEFIYVLEGTPTLRYGSEEMLLSPHMCAGFPAGTGLGHQLINRSQQPVSYLEIGDRTPGDRASYPEDDLYATLDDNGRWLFTHRDGTPYTAAAADPHDRQPAAAAATPDPLMAHELHIAHTDSQLEDCFPVLHALRPHLAQHEFLSRVRRQQLHGYQLLALRHDGRVKSLAGFRFAEFLAWGKVLYIDDFATLETERGRGYGSAVLDWLIDHARAQRCAAIHLDTGYARHAAHRIYLRKGFRPNAHHLALALDGSD